MGGLERVSKDKDDVGVMALGKLNREPAKICLVSSAPPDWRPLRNITWHLMAEYAAQWGYHFRADESALMHKAPEGNFPLRGFRKFDLLIHLLGEGYEWVVWLDADAVITNKSVRIEPFTKRAGVKDLVIGYDVNGHHTTVIMCRNTPLLRDFLWACNNAGRSMFIAHPWHEMESMRYFLQTPPYNTLAHYESVKALCPILHSEYERFGMPANVGQAYSWEPGDWILHLSALSLQRRVVLAQHFADPSHYRKGELNVPPYEQ